jgi:hypothetical protein
VAQDGYYGPSTIRIGNLQIAGQYAPLKAPARETGRGRKRAD